MVVNVIFAYVKQLIFVENFKELKSNRTLQFSTFFSLIVTFAEAKAKLKKKKQKKGNKI